MADRTKRQERADLHGRGKDRNLVRPLTAREVADLRARSMPQPGDDRRRAGIEEFRRALNLTWNQEPPLIEVTRCTSNP
jgi:hypothetical protein